MSNQFDNNCNPKILDLLAGKSSTKQWVFRRSQENFKSFKEILRDVADSLNNQICNVDKNVVVEFEDRGEFEASIRFSGDVIVFQMHSNVFTFDKGHAIWKSSYVKDDPMRAYFGMINMYNFLADSFRYNRLNDLGFLLGRIFVNKDDHFFIEGKREFGFLYNDVQHDVFDHEHMKKVIETAVIYALDFDLTTPEFNDARVVSVMQIQAMSNDLKISTSKKLGYKLRAEREK